MSKVNYQRRVATAVKRARHLGMLPFIGDMLK
jgi:ribosomal protein S18